MGKVQLLGTAPTPDAGARRFGRAPSAEPQDRERAERRCRGEDEPTLEKRLEPRTDQARRRRKSDGADDDRRGGAQRTTPTRTTPTQTNSTPQDGGVATQRRASWVVTRTPLILGNWTNVARSPRHDVGPITLGRDATITLGRDARSSSPPASTRGRTSDFSRPHQARLREWAGRRNGAPSPAAAFTVAMDMVSAYA